jgi:HAD superfamily hydrolase (TIGR01548 family)
MLISQNHLWLFIPIICLSLSSSSASFFVSAVTPPRDSPSLSASMSPLSPSYKTLLVDMDGVLAEVSKSYRAAILATCQTYGAKSVIDETVTEWKARGNANDDWKLSHDLIKADPDGDNNVTLEQVTETFERFYQGHGDTPGLYTLESLIPARETLEELRKRSKPGMGIVTGRPRRDCIKFLQTHNLEHLFDAMYCMEDGPSKPDPFPLKRVCELLGVEPSHSVVLVGDTPDDMQAAVSAGCRGVGVTTPDVVAACEAKGESHTSATLSIVMMERGADVIMPPGFADLVAMFPAP